MLQLFAGTLPDEEQYDVMEGGIQIQGRTVAGKGTLGCIARTDDEPHPRIVGVTCHHLFALWSSQLVSFARKSNHQQLTDQSRLVADPTRIHRLHSAVTRQRPCFLSDPWRINPVTATRFHWSSLFPLVFPI